MLLLVVAACGPDHVGIYDYDKKNVAPEPVIVPVPEVPQPIDILPINFMAGQDITFSWDANPETDLAGYRLLVSSDENFLTDQITEQTDQTEVTVNGLAPGARYYAKVKAFNAAGLEGLYSESITFLVPFVYAAEDTKVEMSYNTSLGLVTLSFAGPEGLIEANEGFVQYSSDLVNWYNYAGVFEYVNGKHIMMLTSMEERMFFRIGFGR